MNNIIRLEGDGVRVQAGVKLADLHDWLAEQVGEHSALDAKPSVSVLCFHI